MDFWIIIYVLFGLFLIALAINRMLKPIVPLVKQQEITEEKSVDNWVCAYCHKTNKLSDVKCYNCGAGKPS